MILNYIRWNVDPEIFNLWGISVRYYGLLFVGGIVICIFILRKMFKIENISEDFLDKLSIWGVIGIFVGARLGHCLFYEPAYYLAHPLEMILPIKFDPDGGLKIVGYHGLASHGGALGLILVLIICCRKEKFPILRLLDLIAVVTPLAAFFIRMANLMNSEIIGIPTTLPWAFIFEREDNIPRHPAQLYEALCYLAIFVVNILLYRYKRQKLNRGFFFGFTIATIFTARFFIEFIKERQVDFEQGMTLDMGQILSIPFIIFGLFFIGYSFLKKNNSRLKNS